MSPASTPSHLPDRTESSQQTRRAPANAARPTSWKRPTSYLRYSSLGLIWAWVYCSWKTELLFPGLVRTNIMSDPSWLGNVVLVIVTLLATPALARRLSTRGRRICLALATAAIVVGVLLSAAFAGSTGADLWRSYLAGACTGFGSGVLLSYTGALLSRLSMDELEIVVPLNILFVPLCSVLSAQLVGTPAAPVFVALLPLASGILLLAGPDVPAAIAVAPAAAREMVPASRISRRDLARTLAFCACFETANASLLLTKSADSVAHPFESLAGLYSATTLVVTLLTTAACMVLINRARHLDIQDACRIAVPLCIVGSAVEALTGDALVLGAASVARSIASTYLSLCCYIWFVRLAATGRIQPYAATGWYMGLFEIGVLAGNLIGFHVIATLPPDEALLTQILLATIVYALATLVIPERRGEEGGSLQLEATRATTTASTDARREAKGSSRGQSSEALREAASAANGTGAAAGAPPARESSPTSITDRAGDARATASTRSPDSPASHAAPSETRGLPRQTSPLHGRLERLDVLAAQAGLTAREAEVCALLAQGRSRPYIRELLHISKNTVDTHAKHAYAKLGVHSIQELLDVLERPQA